MKKSPRPIVIDEKSFRRAKERPEAKEALKRLTGHIVESIPREELPMFDKYFKTQKGQKLLVELWPQIVDAYLKALCAHPESALSNIRDQYGRGRTAHSV
jgi:hypothetical protein